MKRLKPIVAVLFVIYTLAMLWLLFGQRLDREFSGGYWEQLKSMPFPFQTIVMFCRIIITKTPPDVIPHAWQNLIGNVAMFIPLGFCLPLFSGRCSSAKHTFLVGLLIVTGIELTQFFTLLGSLDFDDFLLNSVGILCGYALFRYARNKFGD